MKEQITEEMGIHKKWYEQAEEMTLDELPNFINFLLSYKHDYGTICHAFTAGAIATVWAMDKDEQGSITGFQASCIMWEFIRHWMRYEGSLRLIQYDRMLYPQYERHFQNTISLETWEDLQEKAKEKLKNNNGHPDVIKHWESIVNGNIPFGYVISNDE